MNYGKIVHILGSLLQVEGFLLALPLLVALLYGEKCWMHLAIVMVGAIVIGTLIRMKKVKRTQIHAKEGFVITALSWLLLSLVGALPFWISGEIPDFTDAYFESASGFTTTGASILTDIEAMSHGLLFWRSLTHWIGGMGVLVFILAVLPSNADDMNIMKAESPGPSVEKMLPKVRQTAMVLYSIYLGLTVLNILLLMIFGMPIFDSFCLAFGAAGTGGFGVRNDSIASYSPACQIILTIFMFLFGVNFKLYFLIIFRKFKDVLKSEEVLVYTIIYVVSVGFVTFGILSDVGNFGTALRDGAFQVASVMTTTGYATADFNLWGSMPKAIMVMVMFIGACAGSTGGGMKVSRWILWFKQLKCELSHFLHPRSVKKIRLEGKTVDGETLRTTNVYLMAYVLVFGVSLLLISFDGFDLESTFTAVAATQNNIGPGLGVVGPTGGYSAFSILSKWVMIFDMIAGRLELFPMLILFAPSTWKRR
ncbi:MAG: TrkH family potassium uptake protein [Eubacterium sp.]|nr:TrkH family potassium uptake protein [Eubacterium sp.]